MPLIQVVIFRGTGGVLNPDNLHRGGIYSRIHVSFWRLLPADARLVVPTAVGVVVGRHAGRPLRCGGHPVGTRKGASENVSR